MRSRSFSRCRRAICTAWSADGSVAWRCGAPRRRRRFPSGLTLFDPTPQHRIAQTKFLGRRSNRAATRCDQNDRLPFVVVRKRPTLTSFHSTPPGSASLLQVCPSIRRRFRSVSVSSADYAGHCAATEAKPSEAKKLFGKASQMYAP
jgi:hypothetical protein